MKYGVKIPPDKRAALARRALKIFEAQPNRARGLEAVEDELDVTSPTARNLVTYGRFLRRQEAA